MYLRSAAHMLELHREHPRAVETAAVLGAESAFDLALITPGLPRCEVPMGHTEASWLCELTRIRGEERYGSRESNPEAWTVIDHELDVIVSLGFSGYFLIVDEIVTYCRSNNIWCQGRGSAANSAVCYALGITAVDAVRHKMLFERFLSPGRSGYPDIDLDIESRRREEVIQHVYRTYGREYAAQVANVITYRPKSAISHAAKALGYEPEQAENWSRSLEHRVAQVRVKDYWSHDVQWDLRAQGDQPEQEEYAGDTEKLQAIPADVATYATRMCKLPRHLGIHSGGMILCDRPIIDICPVDWGADTWTKCHPVG